MTSVLDHKANFSSEDLVHPNIGTSREKLFRERTSGRVETRTFSDSSRQYSAVTSSRRNRFQNDYVGIATGDELAKERSSGREPPPHQYRKFEDDNVRFLATGTRLRQMVEKPRKFELNTERVQRLNTFPDGTPRTGFGAEVGLDRLQAKAASDDVTTVKGMFDQVLDGFKNMQAAAAPAAAPIVPAPAAAGAPLAPVAPGAPPAPGARKASVSVSADDAQMFNELVTDPNVLQNVEEAFKRTVNFFQSEIAALEAKSDPVKPRAKKFLENMEKLDFTEINKFIADGGTDINKLPKEVLGPLLKYMEYEREKTDNRGVNPIEIAGPKAPSQADVNQGNLQTELAAKIAGRRKKMDNDLSGSETKSPTEAEKTKAALDAQALSSPSKTVSTSASVQELLDFYGSIPEVATYKDNARADGGGPAILKNYAIKLVGEGLWKDFDAKTPKDTAAAEQYRKDFYNQFSSKFKARASSGVSGDIYDRVYDIMKPLSEGKPPKDAEVQKLRSYLNGQGII